MKDGDHAAEAVRLSQQSSSISRRSTALSHESVRLSEAAKGRFDDAAEALKTFHLLRYMRARREGRKLLADAMRLIDESRRLTAEAGRMLEEARTHVSQAEDKAEPCDPENGR